MVSKAAATVTLTPGSLAQTYTGSSLSAASTTSPTGLAVTYSYTGIGGTTYGPSATGPTAAGSYTVVATINDPNYSNNATGTLVVVKTAVTVTAASNANPVLAQNQVVLTSTISASVGLPTGTVTFLDGTSPLGTSPLSGGVAILTTSSLVVGAHSITAVYNGDPNFLAATSAPLSQTVLDFSLNPVSIGGGSTATAGASATAVPGGVASYTLSIVPTAGTIFPTPALLTVTGMPPGATAIITPSNWTQLTSTSWSFPASTPIGSISLAVQLPNSTASLKREHSSGGKMPLVLLGILLLPFAGRMRRAGRVLGRSTLSILLLLAVSLAATVGLSGCGSLATGFFGQAPQNYTVIVTVTSGNLSHSTTLTLSVE